MARYEQLDLPAAEENPAGVQAERGEGEEGCEQNVAAGREKLAADDVSRAAVRGRLTPWGQQFVLTGTQNVTLHTDNHRIRELLGISDAMTTRAIRKKGTKRNKPAECAL